MSWLGKALPKARIVAFPGEGSRLVCAGYNLSGSPLPLILDMFVKKKKKISEMDLMRKA
jgi:hypothetical protein